MKKTAEEYFNKNHIPSKSHLGKHGLVYEEREVYKIMESYYQHKLKELIPSDDEILKGAIQQDTMEQQVSWGEGATWLKNKFLNK